MYSNELSPVQVENMAHLVVRLAFYFRNARKDYSTTNLQHQHEAIEQLLDYQPSTQRDNVVVDFYEFTCLHCLASEKSPIPLPVPFVSRCCYCTKPAYNSHGMLSVDSLLEPATYWQHHNIMESYFTMLPVVVQHRVHELVLDSGLLSLYNSLINRRTKCE